MDEETPQVIIIQTIPNAPSEIIQYEGVWTRSDPILSIFAIDDTTRNNRALEMLAGRLRLVHPERAFDFNMMRWADADTWATLLALAMAGFGHCIYVPIKPAMIPA